MKMELSFVSQIELEQGSFMMSLYQAEIDRLQDIDYCRTYIESLEKRGFCDIISENLSSIGVGLSKWHDVPEEELVGFACLLFDHETALYFRKVDALH